MIGWLRRLIGLGPPSRREMMAVRDACDGLEARIDAHYAELKTLRGVVHSLKRKEKVPDDAPGSSIASDEVPGPTPRQVVPTAFLARRFKGV